MSFIIPTKQQKGFELPTRIGFKPQETPNFEQSEQESNKPTFEQKNLNLRVLKPFWLMMLLEPEIDEQGNIISLRVMKAFKRESTDDKAKHKQEKPIETLDSFVDEDEQI